MQFFRFCFLVIPLFGLGCGSGGASQVSSQLANSSAASSLAITLKEQYSEIANEKYMGERLKTIMNAESAMYFKRLESLQSISSPSIPSSFEDYLNSSENFGKEISQSFYYSDDEGSLMVNGEIDSEGLGVLDIEFIGCTSEFCRGNISNGFAKYEISARVNGLISRYTIYYDGVINTPVKPENDNGAYAEIEKYILSRAELYGYNSYEDDTPEDGPLGNDHVWYRLLLVTDLDTGSQTLDSVTSDRFSQEYPNPKRFGSIYFSDYGQIDFIEYKSYHPDWKELNLTGADGFRARITDVPEQMELALDQEPGGAFEVRAFFFR